LHDSIGLCHIYFLIFCTVGELADRLTDVVQVVFDRNPKKERDAALTFHTIDQLKDKVGRLLS
jgi:hypothetical protein